MNTKKLAKIIILSLTAIILCCSCSKNAENSNGKLNVVATTTMLFDLSKEIGGEYVNASSLMGIGIDPHLYQASAGDLTKLQKADVVIYNGLHLEGKMGDVFESLKSQGKFSVCIEDALDKESLIKTSEVNNT